MNGHSQEVIDYISPLSYCCEARIITHDGIAECLICGNQLNEPCETEEADGTPEN